MAEYLAEKGAEYDIFTAAHAGLLDHVRKLVNEQPNLVSARGGRKRAQEASNLNWKLII